MFLRQTEYIVISVGEVPRKIILIMIIVIIIIITIIGKTALFEP
jgi:hypothetical protein